MEIEPVLNGSAVSERLLPSKNGLEEVAGQVFLGGKLVADSSRPVCFCRTLRPI